MLGALIQLLLAPGGMERLLRPPEVRCESGRCDRKASSHMHTICMHAAKPACMFASTHPFCMSAYVPACLRLAWVCTCPAKSEHHLMMPPCSILTQRRPQTPATMHSGYYNLLQLLESPPPHAVQCTPALALECSRAPLSPTWMRAPQALEPLRYVFSLASLFEAITLLQSATAQA